MAAAVPGRPACRGRAGHRTTAGGREVCLPSISYPTGITAEHRRFYVSHMGLPLAGRHWKRMFKPPGDDVSSDVTKPFHGCCRLWAHVSSVDSPAFPTSGLAQGRPVEHTGHTGRTGRRRTINQAQPG